MEMNLKTRDNLTTTDLPEIETVAKELLKNALEATETVDVQKYSGDLAQVIDYYNETSRVNTYAAIKASNDPMKAAILTFFYTGIRVKDQADPATKTKTQVIAYKDIPIALGDLYAYCDGIGADRNWIYSLQRFNYHLTVRAAERVGATISVKNFYMDELARQRDLGKNPCSNTQMLRTLQTIVTEMLGDGENIKATSHDVNYLVDCYANDSKKSKTAITCANHKTLQSYMKKICYRILTGGTGYDVEQKEIRK